MPYPKMTALLPLCCVISLTGCGQTRTQAQFTQAPKITIPLELFEPQPEPLNPGPGATQKSVALVGEDFREALAMCNANLATLAKILGVP